MSKDFLPNGSNPNPLPDANSIEREFLGSSPEKIEKQYPDTFMNEEDRRRFEADKKRLRNFLLGLLVTGLIVGGILAVGVVWVMDQLNLIEPNRIELPSDS